MRYLELTTIKTSPFRDFQYPAFRIEAALKTGPMLGVYLCTCCGSTSLATTQNGSVSQGFQFLGTEARVFAGMSIQRLWNRVF